MDLKAALNIIESGQWCSISLFTANVKKGSGGKILELPKCRLARKQNFPKLDTSGTTPRQTNARLHFTRNVELDRSQRIITIHPILITHLNNTELV